MTERSFRDELDRELHDAIADALPEKWRDDWRSFGDPRPILDRLLAHRRTVECPECGGMGRIILDTRDLGGDPCPTCNGDGRVPGETRLAIVERQMPVSCNVLIERAGEVVEVPVFLLASDLPEGTPE